MSEQLFYCTVKWDPKHTPTKDYGDVFVTVYNKGPQVDDPIISFDVKPGLSVSSIYGLNFTRESDTITGHLVPERQLIVSGGRQFFALGIKPGEPVPLSPTSLLFDFRVNINGTVYHADLPPPPYDPPSKPQNLKIIANSIGPKSVIVEWDRSTDNLVVDHYSVYTNGKFFQDSEPGPPFDSTTVSNLVTGLSPNTKYNIQVQAVNIVDKTSGLSESVDVTTKNPLPDCGDWDIRRAPFIDFTAFPVPIVTEYTKESGLDGFVLGFGVCNPATSADVTVYWGGQSSSAEMALATGTYGRQDLSEFTKSGGKFAISFGGANPLVLELKEMTQKKGFEEILKETIDQYDKIIGNYTCTHFDFDFEDGILTPLNKRALELHVVAMIALLQKHPELKISYTLQVDGQPGILEGFNQYGEALLMLLAKVGIQPSLIDGMLMDFGDRAPTPTFQACKVALNGMHKQIESAWPEWNDAKVWRRIGACPMFGKNDNGKIFTLDDMCNLVDFARGNNIGDVSGWDATRDHNQGRVDVHGNPLCPLPDPPLNQCTAIDQKPFDFCKIIATYTPTKDQALPTSPSP